MESKEIGNLVEMISLPDGCTNRNLIGKKGIIKRVIADGLWFRLDIKDEPDYSYFKDNIKLVDDGK
jgi:hypothetical protein